MSYDPSYRMPPRQERWPNATPAEGWPSYGYGQVTNDYAEYATVSGGYAAGTDDSFDGYTGAGYGQATTAYAPGYDRAGPGYAGAGPGYAGRPDDFAGNYLGPGSYIEPGLAGPGLSAAPGPSAAPRLRGDPRLTAPDAGVRPDTWLAGLEYQREASWRGPVVGAVTEVLATGVVIGVSMLAAGLLKARTSPVGAMGTAFIDRTPAALRNLALHHFGTQGRTVLLLGMYAAFAVVAIAIGALARRSAAVGVAGIAMFALFEAFVLITRPSGQVGDVTPAVIGGIAGMAAVVWLFRASAPARRAPGPEGGRAPLRHGRGGTRRRTR